MKNIVVGVVIGNYPPLAAFCSFLLLFRSRPGLAFAAPEGVLAFGQSALHMDRRRFPGRLNCPKSRLPRDASSDLCVAPFGRCFGADLDVAAKFASLDTNILCKRRPSLTGGGRPPDRHLS